jgi:hypothetical protein
MLRQYPFYGHLTISGLFFWLSLNCPVSLQGLSGFTISMSEPFIRDLPERGAVKAIAQAKGKAAAAFDEIEFERM